MIESLKSFRVAGLIRQRIEGGGERLWAYRDFEELPGLAVAQALSRLARAGKIQRLSRGVYYRGRTTAFGPSRPNPDLLRSLAAQSRPIFSSGASAASLLGFSTQTPRRMEVSTLSGSLPRKLIGDETRVHFRRPGTWATLSDKDAAVLDFLRNGGKFNELPEEQMIDRLLALLAEENRFDRLAKIAHAEPPRVRAMLGALGERLGRKPRTIRELRESLNPLSRFDFGRLAALPNAQSWQSKTR